TNPAPPSPTTIQDQHTGCNSSIVENTMDGLWIANGGPQRIPYSEQHTPLPHDPRQQLSTRRHHSRLSTTIAQRQ
ncbi:unnamed protein product, partial [Scytosiphon promiscuus]